MKVAYFDLIGGASGNMLLGALLDAGLDRERLAADLERLHLPGWSLDVRPVTRRGIAAALVEVRADAERTERRFHDLLAVLQAADLAPEVKRTSTRILTRLGEVEAHIHAQPLSEVHLHELGGIDTLVDIAGSVSGLAALGIERVVVSPFPLARGQMQSAHGTFPLPSPATVSLLQGAPVVGVAGERETVTPTAAAVLTGVASAYGVLPPMTLQAVGYGAGSREDPAPNVLRVLVGEAEENSTARVEAVVELKTNIDDMNPQSYDYLMGRLFAAGALDVTLAPLQMKKNRPGTRLEVLAPVARASELRSIILNETTTLGVREQIITRVVLEREIITVETRFGTLHAKVARRPDGRQTVVPEYEDCVRAAREHQVPLAVVTDMVKAEAQKRLAIV